MKKILLLGLCLLLTACASNVRYVPTPVKCPAPEIKPEPAYLPLAKNAQATDFTRFCVYNYKAARIDAKVCRMQLRGYQ